ncbi:hypothetical protein FAI41_03930 [Acetobacteraceae bacterium]|nr:hypothetical protein FAI41_03930 [Acetobacteraceae bacterium]
MKFPKSFLKSGFSCFLSACLLAGCVDPVENLKPTTFPEDLNAKTPGRVVTILTLMPAKAQVDNMYNHNLTAEIVGDCLGILLGVAGMAGSSPGMIAGWYIGKAIGGWIGGAIEPPELHPQAMIIAYQDPNVPHIQQVIEIARPCEFKTGMAYAVMSDIRDKVLQQTRPEMRIQPNNFAACRQKLKESGKK